MIKVAVIGYGNIGVHAVEAVCAAEDMELAGVVRRQGSDGISAVLADVKVTDSIDKLDQVDVALLCKPSRSVEKLALSLLAEGIRTVDCFDIHDQIVGLRETLNEAAKKSGTVAVTAAGWDPGSDSVIRALLAAIAPRGLTYTDFGPGMSMGHTVAVKDKKGVADALSITIPLGAGIHRRMVYVQLEKGADIDAVTRDIKSDPYFSHDETHVVAVSDVTILKDRGHGVHLTRKAGSGSTDNQMFTFDMRINNPALTAQVMAACARAAYRQQPGAYTMIELPMIDLLPGNRADNIRQWV